ncbi:hypothetical protein [Amycolatopsis sp. NPDC098790]|uniref:hypothetical protein n=1 Tax=Amycolatopsis sp. NPDC098790 TaxID=3363939 RepID=UPI0038182733
MTVDFESLATLLPITFAALFAIAFTVGLTQQWATGRKQQAPVKGRRNAAPRGARLHRSGRDRR